MRERLARVRQAWQRARSRRWVRWSVDAFVILLILAAVSAWQTRNHLRDNAPAFSVKTLDGADVSLASLRGKPVLLEFWAPWCTVCKAQSQNISWLRKLAGSRAQVYSVASAYGSKSEVERYVREKGVDYPVLLGGDDLASAYRIDAYPTMYFLDGDGRIKRSAAGYTTSFGLLWRLLF